MMALFHVNFMSRVLGQQMSCDVILPQAGPDAPGKPGNEQTLPDKFPTLYLLHGMSDDHTIWQRRTNIERYVEGRNLAVVMPAVQLSWYTDMYYGKPFFTYITQELPQIMESFFPLSDRREDRFAAGLSMGGYGAMKCGLRCPDKYGAVASLSGALDHLSFTEEGPPPEDSDWGKFLLTIFGPLDKIPGSDNDLMAVARKQIAAGTSMPKMFVCCGTEDFLIEQNRRFYGEFKNDFDLAYFEEPGTHEWGFWDDYIKKIVAWLPIK